MGDYRGSAHSRIIQYRHERSKFSRKVYLIAAIFILLSLTQWVIFGFIDIGTEEREHESKLLGEKNLESVTEFKQNLKDYFYVAFPFLFLGLLLTTVFVISTNVRFFFPLNWILTVCIVEFITIGMIWAVLESKWSSMLICAAVVLVILAVFLIIGACIPGDLTLHVMLLFAFATVFVVGSILTTLWGLLTEKEISILIYLFFIALLVLIFIIYHAQTIHGGRFAEMRLNDYLLASLIIYHDYIILYLLTLFIYTAYIQDTILHVVAMENQSNQCINCNGTVTISLVNVAK